MTGDSRREAFFGPVPGVPARRGAGSWWPRLRRALLALTVAALVAAATGTGAAHTPQRPATVFYVDSVHGSDARSGLSAANAWRTLERGVEVSAGDTVRIRRGSRFTGPTIITWTGSAGAPVVIDAYGSGPAPLFSPGLGADCLVISGSHVVLRSIEARGCPDAGVRLIGTGDTVRDSLLTGSGTGIAVNSGADHCRILYDRLLENNRMIVNTRGGDDDYGAMGVDIGHAKSCEVAYNEIVGSHALSYDFGTDGSAVELYGAVGTRVHHNLSVDNLAFTELGSPGTSDNVFYYNVIRASLPDAAFLTTHAGASKFGGVTGTRAINNTVVLTGARATAFYCDSCKPEYLVAENNFVFASRLVGFAGSWGDQDNLFNQVGGFVDAAIGNYRLTAASSAVRAGVRTPYNVIDFAGTPVVGAPDIGAYQFRRPAE